MAKRLTEKQKEEIIKLFISGYNIDDLSKQFNCTKLTISRNLKKTLGDEKFKQIYIKSKLDKKLTRNKEQKIDRSIEIKRKNNKQINKKDINKSKISLDKELLSKSQFIEIAPLNCDIDNLPQKELSSVPISDVLLPKKEYMIVDNKNELEIKLLKDYPNWEFMPEEDLKRKTIEIYFDLKIAKTICSKEQKVIKVPNTDVFRIVSPILIARGISRIISSDSLIAL